LLATRIALLHLRINVGPHTFIECTAGRDFNSPYYYRHLLTHIGFLSDRAPRERFGVELIDRLLSLEIWPAFVDYHLRVLADLYARRLGDLSIDPDERFGVSRHRQDFAAIARVVREFWEP